MTQIKIGDQFIKALTLANDLHKDQFRKGTNIPYISHLMAVASLVIENGGTEEEAIAALLHDAVEDCGGPPILEKIRQQFGESVAHIVDGCSEPVTEPEPPWKERKLAYIAHVKQANPSVRLVSCADKLHNVCSVLFDYRQQGEKLWDRFNAGKKESIWFYRTLAKELRANGERRPILDELDQAVSDLERIVK